MKKSLLVVTALIACIGTGWAQNVSSVVIDGEKNVKEKTIRAEIKTKAGKTYSEEQVLNDIKNIQALGSFENVEAAVDTTTWKVTFTVSEKPLIKSIVMKGNKKFSTGTLREEIPLKVNEFFEQSKLEESRVKIQTKYSDKGYADMKLEVYPTTDESTNQMTITWLINEGNRILIGNVNLEGIHVFKEKKIRKLVKTKRKKVFKQETLNEDIQSILTFYRDNGYTEAKVSDPKITYNQDRTLMNITLSVTEGPRFMLGDIVFAGNSVFSDGELRRSLVGKKGKIFSEAEFKESLISINELYSDKGYLGVRLDPQLQPDSARGIMNILISITEGTQVHLGSVYIDGLTHTKETVIRRELTLKEGDVFAAPKVRRSVEKIYNLGFIDSVEPEIQPTDKPDLMDLVLNVTEGKPGVLSAGAGYSSVDKLVGTLQVQHINLLGRAQRLNLMWEFGERKQNYEIDWTEPWFLDKPMSLGFGIFNTDRTREYLSIANGYQESRKGGSVRVGPRLTDEMSLLFSYSYEDIKLSDFDTAIPSTDTIRSEAGPNVTSSLSSQIVYDTRDNIFDASRGVRQSLSLQIAGGPFGGGVDYIKPIIRSSWFFPTFWKFVLSLNGTVGLVESFGRSKDVNTYDRFFVGGADTVRGYEFRSEISPTNGGKSMMVFNAEYKFPIVAEKKRTILQGAFFFDVGGAWEKPGDINLRIGNGPFDMKSGAGFGIRFTTPVFPLRLDWGYGFNHKTGQQLSQFYFTIGNVF